MASLEGSRSLSLSARSSNSNPEEEDGDNESKTRKHTSFVARISAHVHHGSGSHCLAVSFSLFLLLLVASFLFSCSRPMICVPAYNSIARTAQANHEGLASDFGFLGVPWCRTEHGKTVEWKTKDLLKGLAIHILRPSRSNQRILLVAWKGGTLRPAKRKIPITCLVAEHCD